MAENVEFLIDAQYPNRRAVEDFLKDVKEVKATLASFGKEARAVKALSASVASLNKSLSKKVALADAAAKAELQAQKAASEAARTRAANAKADREEEKAAQERQKTLQQKLKTQQQLIDRGEKARARNTKKQAAGTATVTKELQKQVFVTKKLSTAAERLAKAQRRSFGRGATSDFAFGQILPPGATGGKGFNFRPPAAAPDPGRVDRLLARRARQAAPPVLEEIGAPTKEALSAAARFRREMERARGAVRRTAAETKKLATSTAAAAKGARASRGQFRLLNGTVGRSIRSVSALAAIFTTLEGIKLGTAFSDQLVQAKAQIAGLIASSAKLSDASGNIVGATDAYPQLLGLANGQIEKLKKNALETASTFGQLLENFQTAIGPGLAAGLNVDQVRELTVQISQAATAIGLEQRQLAEEVRSLFTGAINPRNSRIATVLGITPEDVKQARAAGELAQFLEGRLAGITTAAKTLQGTLLVTFSNLGDRLQQVAGTAFEPFRQRLLDLAGAITDSLGPGGVGRDLIAGIGSALARGAEQATNFVANLNGEKLREFGRAIREIAGFLSSLLSGILPGVAQGFLALAAVASILARTLKAITDSAFGRTLVTAIAIVGVFTKVLLTLRAAFISARAAALAFQASLPGVGVILAAAAAAAGAYYLASEELSDANQDVAGSLEDIQKQVEEAGKSMDLFFNRSIDEAGKFSDALKQAADQIKRLQTASSRSVAREGLDAGFRDAVGSQLGLPLDDLKQKADTLLTQANAAFDKVDAARNRFSDLQDLATLDQEIVDSFRADSTIDLQSGKELAALEKQAAESAARASVALKRLNDSQRRATDLESQRIVAQRALRQAIKDTADAESRALTAIEPRLQRQSQLRQEQAAASIRAAEEQLKASVGRPGGVQGSERAELDRKISLIERELQLRGEDLTVRGLLAKAAELEKNNQFEGAAAARRLAEAAEDEFEQRERLFELTDKLKGQEVDRLRRQEETANLLSEQARKLREIDSFADKLDTAAQFVPLQAQFSLQETAQETRVQAAGIALQQAQDQLRLAKERGDTQQVINDLLDGELDATERLLAAQNRLAELRRQEAERTQVGAGFQAGLRGQQVGAGESAAQFAGASINALRGGLNQVVADAFDPTKSVNLVGALLNIGQQITQALFSALIEQAIIQPLITSLIGASATPAVAISAAFAKGSILVYNAIVAAMAAGSGAGAPFQFAGTAAGGFGGAVNAGGSGIGGFGFAGGRVPGFNDGGTVGAPNLASAPAGLHPQDRVLTALTPGEGVLNRGAMQALGSDWLNSVNRDFGKIRVGRSRRAGKIQGFNTGGVVGGGGGGARPSIRSGGGGSSILVADRESARILLRNRAFDERAAASRRTLKAL